MQEIEIIRQHLEKVDPKHFARVERLIDGRVPHDKINVLYALREMMGPACRIYFEIGVHNGGSMGLAMQHRSSCKFYGVDMFEEVLKIPRYKYFESDNLSVTKTKKNIREVNTHSHPFKIFVGNSQDTSIVLEVFNEVKDLGVNLMFIDGDHSYQGVRSDFENYSPLVARGGYIVFDDYRPKDHPEIAKFIDEFNYNGWEKIGETPNEFIIKRL